MTTDAHRFAPASPGRAGATAERPDVPDEGEWLSDLRAMARGKLPYDPVRITAYELDRLLDLAQEARAAR